MTYDLIKMLNEFSEDDTHYMYVSGRFANKALLKKVRDRIMELEVALKDCADDLEEELLGRYVVGAENFIHPARQTAFDRDMATVRVARAALEKTK